MFRVKVHFLPTGDFFLILIIEGCTERSLEFTITNMSASQSLTPSVFLITGPSKLKSPALLQAEGLPLEDLSKL